MKIFTGALCFIIAPIVLPVMAFSQIPNGDFENWQICTCGMTALPGWNISNYGDDFSIISYTLVSPGPPHSGMHSLAAKVDSIPMLHEVMAPSAVTKEFPVSTQPPSLHGFYRLNLKGGDYFSVTVSMRAFDEIIGVGAFTDTGNVADWKGFVANINYTTTIIPETCSISINIYPSLVGNGVHAGSNLLIDDLTFGPATGVQGVGGKIPDKFNLEQNYPNPFNPSTNFGFRITDFGFVTLKIFNILGQELATIINGWKAPGEYQAQWNAAKMSSGMYFYRLDATSVSDPAKRFSETRKLILVK